MRPASRFPFATRLLQSLGLLLAILPCTAEAQTVTYFDQTSAQHEAQITSLSSQGYRMTSLSIYGGPLDPRYSAVWTVQAGPAWVECHGLSSAGYQSFFNAQTALGYFPVLVSATGPVNIARFAAVFEQTTRPGAALHDVDRATFDAANVSMRAQGARIVTAAVYGTSTAPRYVASWTRNDEKIAWAVDHAANDAEFSRHQDELTKVWLRPKQIAMTTTGHHVSIWYDEVLAQPFTSKLQIDSTYLPTVLATEQANGKIPLSLTSCGASTSIRHSAVFCASSAVLPRTLSQTGTQVPELAAFDAYVENLLVARGIRAASLAIVRDGRLVLARGYTLAEPGYPQTKPESLFRIASCTKPLTSIAMHSAMAKSNGSLTPSRAFLPYLPSFVALDARTKSVTLDHLLTHRGGWDRDVSFDPMFRDVEVGTYVGHPAPVTKRDIFEYMTESQMLDFTPGALTPKYSNYGYMLLGMVLESVNSGLGYGKVLQNTVATPLGIPRMVLGRTALSQAHATEVRYHPSAPGLAAQVVGSPLDVLPVQYGSWNQDNLDANGGVVCAAPDYAKVLAAFALGNANPLLDTTWTNQMWSPVAGSSSNFLRGWFQESVTSQGTTMTLRWHNGRLAGSAAFVALRSDNVGFCLFVNCDASFQGTTTGTELSMLADQVTTWPNHDLFPSHGIPSIRTRVAGAFATYGAACAGSAGLPRLAGSGVPELGYTFTLGGSQLRQNAPAFLFLGSSRSVYQTIPLPWPVPGAPGCNLLAGPEVVLPLTTSASGTASIPLTVPMQKEFIGGRVATQLLVTDPSVNALGLVFTQGVEVVLGGWR